MAARAPVRVLIADDHPLIRKALREELEGAGIEVCAEAAAGPKAVQAAVKERPDVCVLDIQMPGDGMDATREIRRSLPGTRIVLTTATPDEPTVLAAARAGADGYLAKGISGGLPEIVRAVAGGEVRFPWSLLVGALRRDQERSGD